MNTEEVYKIIEKNRSGGDGLIAILTDLQSRYSYLPEEALRIIAAETGRSLVDVYGVATFYKAFSLKPRGNHLVSCCLGTACHVRGAPNIAAEMEKQLGIASGETTVDREFSLETVNCLGACALGPVVVVDGHYFPNVKKPKVKEIIAKVKSGLDKVEFQTDLRVFPLQVSCPRCNHNLMDPNELIDCYPSIRVTISFGQQHGWLKLSCLYGSHNVVAEYEPPENAIVQFFCPHCHAELRSPSACPECSAPLVPMIVRWGGMLQICSRRGCKGHLLDLVE